MAGESQAKPNPHAKQRRCKWPILPTAPAVTALMLIDRAMPCWATKRPAKR
jgi:hypothetical protein